MGDRYRSYTPSGRSATFNPARTSLPTSIGYTSLYAGDINVMPSSTRHHTTTPRGYTASNTTSGVPTTTRTYAVTQDPRSMRPTTRDISRHRSSTLDSSTHRPPVIVMTTQGKDRPHASSSHSSNARSGSPIRDEYRSSEGQFYTQPASSIRSRSHARQFSEQLDNDEYARIRERSDNLLREDPYRGSRHSVIYPNNSRHSSAAIDYGDEGYQYTNAGELARYDLDHTVPSSRSRRRESIDRGYYRPNINYNPDQRSLNVNGTPDLSRNYNVNTNRPYENRGGPPPSTRGFDKIGREYYETPRDVPPAAPAPPDPTVPAQVEVAGTVAEGRRARPVSLYQEGPPRSIHHDDYYRSREDERGMRELRDGEVSHEPDRAFETPYYDDRVTSRGFGIRTDPVDDFDDRRDHRPEYRPEEPKKRPDDERESELEREERRRRRDSKDVRRERRESKRGSDDDEKERSRFRDKMAAGLGIAATAMGLAPSAAKDDDKREKEKEKEKDREPRRHRGSDEDRDRRGDSDDHDRPRASDRSRSRPRDYERRDVRDEVESKDRRRREPEPRKNNEAIISASDSDEAKKTTRRHRKSNAFDPNDTSDLKQIKEQLATLRTSEKDNDREKPVVIETTRNREPSPLKDTQTGSAPNKDLKPALKETQAPRDPKPSPPPKDETRGREIAVAAPGDKEKQVRVVSPPREKKDEKPIKGILKQPKVQFPEEPNPIREGVAPHKEDKKIKDAPPGAKWTRISRKIVNPEALTIGKERFEVRDDFVIVLRVLSKEEIQAYAAATQVLRERRRRDDDGDRDDDYDRDRDRDRDDEDKRRHHRHRRHRDEDEADRDDKDRDRERRRRHRDDDDYDPRSRDPDHHHHHRSHRDRDAVEA